MSKLRYRFIFAITTKQYYSTENTAEQQQRSTVQKNKLRTIYQSLITENEFFVGFGLFMGSPVLEG